MKKLVKRIVAYIYKKVADSHDKDIAKAKKVATNARLKLYEAQQEADVAEQRFNDTLESMRLELAELQTKFSKAIEVRNAENEDLKQIQAVLKDK